MPKQLSIIDLIDQIRNRRLKELDRDHEINKKRTEDDFDRIKFTALNCIDSEAQMLPIHNLDQNEL